MLKKKIKVVYLQEIEFFHDDEDIRIKLNFPTVLIEDPIMKILAVK